MPSALVSTGPATASYDSRLEGWALVIGQLWLRIRRLFRRAQ